MRYIYSVAIIIICYCLEQVVIAQERPKCGEAENKNCTGPTNLCCSIYGRCGDTDDFCAPNNCNILRGKCGLDHHCGFRLNKKCTGKFKGKCCNKYTERCGDGNSFCAPDVCEPKYGGPCKAICRLEGTIAEERIAPECIDVRCCGQCTREFVQAEISSSTPSHYRTTCKKPA